MHNQTQGSIQKENMKSKKKIESRTGKVEERKGGKKES